MRNDRPHRKCSVTIFFKFEKLDLTFVQAMPKLSCSAVRERNIIHEFWIKNVCLVPITSTSPKVDVTANKLVPRIEKWSPRGSKLFQINLTFLDVRLVISVSIAIFLVFLFFYVFFVCFFKYYCYGIEC